MERRREQRRGILARTRLSLPSIAAAGLSPMQDLISPTENALRQRLHPQMGSSVGERTSYFLIGI